ncbi:hypothetical protein [Paenarthrobacter nitroguajacolicus]|uniref:hypothetical protein n=1 Tax=Paenarthrobacter nitroguajacolicus TaxID=211146 RepID=UPI000A8BCE29|nr:hypothetical protein [Paenarthrobacter nitroguajacolicus]
MTDNEKFPVIGTEIVIKVDNEADFVDNLPILVPGESFIISDDGLSDVAVGQFVLISKVPEREDEFTFLVTDETSAAGSNSDELGARVSEVVETAVTLEVLSPLDEGGVR